MSTRWALTLGLALAVDMAPLEAGAANGTVIAAQGHQAVVEFRNSPQLGQTVQIAGESSSNSGTITRVQGHKAVVMFQHSVRVGARVGAPGRRPASDSNVKPEKPHPHVLLAYSYQDSYNVHIPIGHFSLGASYASKTVDDGTPQVPLSGTYQMIQAKGGYWLSGIGESSAYVMAGGGYGTLKMTGTVTVNGHRGDVTDSMQATYMSAEGGYLWYWNHVNLGLGLYYLSVTLPSSTATTTLPALDSGISIPGSTSSSIGVNVMGGCTF